MPLRGRVLSHRLCHRALRALIGVVVLMTANTYVFSADMASAAPATSPSCATGVGVGGTNSSTVASTRGGNGCVVIQYLDSGVTQYETFNYTGTDQTWTVPAGVSSVTVYALGAGGGGVPLAGDYGDGGGGGFATGNYSVSNGQTLTVIVGQGGGGELLTLRSGTGTSGCYTGSLTYGGGGRGSSCWSGYAYENRGASAGGRSAIRLSDGTEIVTAGGGGGGGWQSNGGAGGGTSGLASRDAGGGTQSAGGTTANALATRGAQFLGGNGYHQGGGGGGGYYGGGGGYSISGGGGGSSYVALLTDGATVAGAGTSPGVNIANLVPAVSTSPSCASGVGVGGQASTLALSQAGHGCIVIKYGSTFATFNFLGIQQRWIVPSGVTSVEFHLLGAGGGGGRNGTSGHGGGGGYAMGTYSVTAGQEFTVIVGEGGVRQNPADVAALTTAIARRNVSFGGGASGQGNAGYGYVYGSGGGRSAIRLAGSTDDLATAGAGGGGGYTYAAGAGGGLTGQNAGGTGGFGGSQIAGGATYNSEPGVAGIKYAGGYAGTVLSGNQQSEAGGGGGGYYGGGAGGDNGGGGGGSSYVALLTNGSTIAGNRRDPGLKMPVNTTAPTISGSPAIGATLTAKSGTWAATGIQSWQWQFSSDGVTYTNIAGANSATYSPTQAGYFRVVESHSNILGVATGTSTATNVQAPVVTSCTPTANTFTHCRRFNFYGADQTFTMPSDLPVGHTFQIETWGAGGGGNCCNYYASDFGGGAGGYQRARITIANVGEQYTIVVGERGEPRDVLGGYGGGGAGGPSVNAAANPGASGGGMSGVFIGAGTTQPLMISGGGGGTSPGHGGVAGTEAGGGGGNGDGSAGSSTTAAGRAGTTSAGGAPATNGAVTSGTTCPVVATAGSQYQGGRGCGTTVNGTEGGGGGGGGYFGGGGGKDQMSGSTNNGGGGGGSGFLNLSFASSVTSTVGARGARTNNPGGTGSDQYVSGIGVGGSGYVGTLAGANGGHGMVVFQWAVPPTARADSKSGGVTLPISLTPSTNDTATLGGTITASSVRLCGTNEVAPACTQTSLSVANEGSYSVNTTTGLVTFTGEVGFVGTSSVTYSIADNRGARASSTLSFTTLAPPTARVDEVAGPKGETLQGSPLANDSAAGTATIDSSTLRLCSVSPAETAPNCTATSVAIANEGTYSISNGRVTFNSHPSYTGTRTLTYVVADSNGQFTSSTISFTALPPPAVLSLPDVLTVNHNQSAVMYPLVNDSAGTIPVDYTTQGTVSLINSSLRLCGPSETLTTGCTQTSVQVVGEGTWMLNVATGAVTFVPLVTFFGVATPVTYAVCNSVTGTWAPAIPAATCGSSSLTTTVNAPNMPVPSTDALSGAMGQALSIAPLANDAGTGLTASRMRLCDVTETAPNCYSTTVAVAGEGTWTLNTSTGDVTFVPLPTFAGDATPITYVGSDVVGQSFSANLTASIQLPAAAVLGTDMASGAADGDIVVLPLANDTGTGLSASSLFICGANDVAPSCTQSSLVVAGKGEWNVDRATGRLIFTPDAGFVGTVDPLTYSVADILNRQSSSTIALSVAAIAAPNTPDLVSSSDSGLQSDDNNTSDDTPTIAVPGVPDGQSVTVTATQGATTVTCSFVAGPGTNSCDMPTMADGTWTVTAVRTDANNNVSSVSAGLTVVIDTVAPTTPAVPDLSSSSDTGSSSSDDVTSDDSPFIELTSVPAGLTVTFTATSGNASVTCSFVAGAVSGCSLPNLSDGPWSITAVVTDLAGNVSSSSAALNITIDTSIAPPTTTTTTTTSTTTTTVPAAIAATTTTTSLAPKTTVTSTTLPNSKVPYDSIGMEKILQGLAAVAGMPKDGWVKVESTSTEYVITTSEGLRIEIGAQKGATRSGIFNSRGMLIFEPGDEITIAGEGLMPNSPASTWMFSTPTELGQMIVGTDGSFSEKYQVSEDIQPGDHTAQLNGIAPDGTLRVVEVKVEVIAPQPVVDEVPQPAPDAKKLPNASPMTGTDLLTLIASAYALLAITRRGTGSLLALESASSEKDDDVEREEAGGDLASVDAGFGDGTHAESPDRVRPPVVRRVDMAMKSAAMRIDRWAPMMSRIVDDGSYVRSLLGIGWILLPLAGAVLGVLSAINTDFTMMIPSLALVTAVIVVGVLDAMSGFAFTVTFALAMLIGGGFKSVDSIRGFLGIAVFAFAPALVASAVRPFRRRATGVDDAWKRISDVVLIALFGSWAAGSMYSALPSLTTYRPSHSDKVDYVHVVVLVALVARWVMENGARILTPRRLHTVEVGKFDVPYRSQEFISYLVRTAVFVFVAVVFIGNNWALWLGTAMFLVPKIVSEFSSVFPNVPALYRYVPRKLFRTFVMLFVAMWWGTLVQNNFGDSSDAVRYAFVLMGIPGLVLGAIDWFGRDGKKWTSTPLSKTLGVVILILGFLVVRGYIF